ncbi:hypothetical protein DFS34DRAFT_259381 [Phlyctochytrium arcticum]|nr:hypothetical protein DFS34DRAFT_259381 [Phlyctochytrium arcticum]
MEWGQPNHRIIGHVRFSPALTFNVGLQGFTEDWGAFELAGSKFEDAFKGNFINLDTDLPIGQFTCKIYPRDNGHTTFKYAADRLLKI